MDEQRKGRNRPAWTTTLLIRASFLYVASFGLACWAVGRGSLDAELAAAVYRPIVLLTWRGPNWIAGPLYRIAGVTAIGDADGLFELQYAAGRRDVLGGSRMYRVDDLVIRPTPGR